MCAVSCSVLNGKCRLPENELFLLENVRWTQEITWDRVFQCWGQALSPSHALCQDHQCILG